jgi:hypothetical protein
MSAETVTRCRRWLQWPVDVMLLTLAHEDGLPRLVVRILVGC